MKSIALIIILLTLFLQKDVVTESINSWGIYPVPDREIAESYNMGNPDWTVFEKQNEIFATNDRGFQQNYLPFNIIIRKNDGHSFAGKQSIMEVDDGFLLGLFRGEWGGELWWFSKDGKKRYRISDHIIVSILKYRDKVFAIEGLAHLRSSSGGIIEVLKENGKWTTKEYLELPSAPDAIDIYDNTFIIMTSTDLIKVDEGKNIEYLIKNGFWKHYLYPTSMVVQNDIAYIGMRKGILTYDLVTGKQSWLMPNTK